MRDDRPFRRFLRSREVADILGVSVNTLRTIPEDELPWRVMTPGALRSPRQYWSEDVAKYILDYRLRRPVGPAEWVTQRDYLTEVLRQLAQEPQRWHNTSYPRVSLEALVDVETFLNLAPPDMDLPWPYLNLRGDPVLMWDAGPNRWARATFFGTGHYTVHSTVGGEQTLHIGDEWPASVRSVSGFSFKDRRNREARELDL